MRKKKHICANCGHPKYRHKTEQVGYAICLNMTCPCENYQRGENDD